MTFAHALFKSYAVFACSVCALLFASLPFPFTVLSIPDMLASKKVDPDSVHPTMIGLLTVLCVNASWNNGRVLPWRALHVARSGSAGGSV